MEPVRWPGAGAVRVRPVSLIQELAAEAVVVDAAGGEVADLDVDGVVELGVGGGGAASDDPSESLVVGQFPVDGDAFGGQPAVGLVRGRGEAGPQEHGGGQRVAGGHAEGEGVLGDLPRVERGGGRGTGRGQVGGEGERGGGSRAGEEAAAVEVPGGGPEFGCVRRTGLRRLMGCACHLAFP